jgi:ABC-type bacteriocin/lantibiotic exporter with double-glycine peptidase domain
VIGIGLLISATSLALFNLVQSTGLLRIEGRLDLRLQSALWDRLVRAPAAFFRDHSSGDLVSRMQSVDTMRKLLTGSVISTIVSSVMGLFSLGLMLYYAPLLSLVLALITIAFTIGGFLLGWRLVTLDREALMLSGSIQSMVVQLLDALSKLRVASVEDIAFQRWSRLFRSSQDVANKSGHAYVAMLALMGVLGPLTLAVLFAFLGFQTDELMDFFRIPTNWDQITGHAMDKVMPMSSFVAFLNAYVQFMTAITGMMVVGIRLSSLSPLMGRLKPIFRTPTEQFGAQDNPGEIVGRVEFKNVTFRYDQDGPAILNNLSLSIEPGEFVALVGPSGSGKSSAMRLLLGFETQESGSIYLDGRDLGRLDKTLVREQLGVVVQEGKLIPGTIFDNLTGGADVSREDVWEAARQVGFDNDLKNMPQGLDTPINDGASNISGGQRQRLLVARALIRKPRMLVLDEATSALDNETQEIVSRTIPGMNITRIAVAHRLSTIIKADRIFVIVAGSVVESGTYDDLLKLNRVFADLVRQQIE